VGLLLAECVKNWIICLRAVKKWKKINISMVGMQSRKLCRVRVCETVQNARELSSKITDATG